MEAKSTVFIAEVWSLFADVPCVEDLLKKTDFLQTAHWVTNDDALQPKVVNGLYFVLNNSGLDEAIRKQVRSHCAVFVCVCSLLC